MAKRGYHHGNLRQALVDAALELIEQKGPTGFTLSEAAKQAGVTPAAVYRHFDGREALIAEVALQGHRIFGDLMEHRPQIQVSLGGAEGGFGLGELDVPLPQIALIPFNVIGA